jgi:transport and Golgi organization protein 2
MCTVTVRRDAGGLLLTMNRDERLDRAPEEPPRRIPGEVGRPSWIAPFDGASGGTWIGVNDRGVAACVLNGYGPRDRELRGRPGVPSRGSIIPRILEDQDGERPVGLRDAIDFSAYPSFTLLVVSSEGGQIVRWTHGEGIAREPVPAGWSLLTSSSWNEPGVARFRRDEFAAWLTAGEPEVEGIPVVHLHAEAGRERESPFMTREDSATRSISQVRIRAGSGEAWLSWWPRAGKAAIDPHHPGAVISLPRAAEAPRS